MTPIVNPIFFWLIDAGSNLRITFGILAIVFFGVWGGIKFFELLDFDGSERSITWMLIIGIISGIFWAMIPSANTCYKIAYYS